MRQSFPDHQQMQNLLSSAVFFLEDGERIRTTEAISLAKGVMNNGLRKKLDKEVAQVAWAELHGFYTIVTRKPDVPGERSKYSRTSGSDQNHPYAHPAWTQLTAWGGVGGFVTVAFFATCQLVWRTADAHSIRSGCLCTPSSPPTTSAHSRM